MLPHDSVNFKQFYYEGVDGLKTGHIDVEEDDFYNFTGTALRNNQRLITVVMKTDEETEGARFKETIKLLDYGFKFENQELFSAGYQLEGESEIPVAKGKEDVVTVSLGESVSFPVKAGEEESYHIEYHMEESL